MHNSQKSSTRLLFVDEDESAFSFEYDAINSSCCLAIELSLGCGALVLKRFVWCGVGELDVEDEADEVDADELAEDDLALASWFDLFVELAVLFPPDLVCWSRRSFWSLDIEAPDSVDKSFWLRNTLCLLAKCVRKKYLLQNSFLHR